MNTKRFIPCIYLFQKRAVEDFDKKETVIDNDPVALSRFYSDSGADGLIVFDLSESDREQEEALHIIKKICAVCEVPVIGAGNIKRMEDVKKLIYAGCSRAALNYSKQSNIELTKEVSLKFGKDRIAVCIDTPKTYTDNKELLEKYVKELICINDHAKVEWEKISSLSYIGMSAYEDMEQMFAYLSTSETLSGISGRAVNERADEIQVLKALCKDRKIPVVCLESKYQWEDFKLNTDGMIPVIVQDYQTDEVLMEAYMNKEAYEQTLRTGKMTYYSRSRKQLWLKGETSGHFQYVKSLTADCDLDTILAKVSQVGAACHTGNRSCFFHEITAREYEKHNPMKVLEAVMDVIKDRKIHPREGSYTNYLFEKGIDKILKKLGEEATEIVIAAKNPDADEIKYEIADFLYHMMVLMAEKGVTWEEITVELADRQ